MLNPISEAVRNAKTRPALMTHVVAGFPSVEKSKQIVRMMNGIADIIEIQIPFSDPVADGPTMQRCNELALHNGFRVDEAFTMAAELTTEVSCPVLFMTYYNIIYKRGVAEFCAKAKASGIQGMIVPDMPIDEESREHFIEHCRINDLSWIPVVSPLTDSERIAELAKYAGGFWYLVSRTGVTGVEGGFSTELRGQISEIQKNSDLPVAMAFGVSSPEHVEAIRQLAEMAVVGSLVQNFFLRDTKDFEENLNEAKECLLALRKHAA